MRTETLLAETGFLERLAASLTFGAEDPADVVQETWLAALSHPPRDGAGARSWLAVVLRNALRQSRRSRLRRAAREMIAARPEATSPAEEVRRREETRAEVVKAVLSLEEPCRTAVLLRYFEELPPRKIAARLAVPVATVKSRIARGLRQLRARLDDEHGRDGRAWALALLPIVGIRGGGPGGATGASSAGKIAAGAATAALLVAGGVTLFGDDPESAPRDEEAPPGATVARADPPAPPADLSIGDGSGSYGGDPARPFGRPSGGRVVDARGRGVPGATILLLQANVPGYLTTNEQFPNRAVALTELDVMVREAEGGPLMLDIPLLRSRSVRFTVVDKDGEPVAGVRLYPKDPAKFAEDEWTSDGRGEVVVGLRVMPERGKGGLGVLARHPYQASHFDVGGLLIGERRGLFGQEEFRMKVWRYRPVRVTVLAEDGTVLANRPVLCHRREIETDGKGEFVIELLEYTGSVTVKAGDYLAATSRTEAGRAVVRLRPARRITVRVVAPEEVKDKRITVSLILPGTRASWDSGTPGRDGRSRTLDLELPVGESARVRAETHDQMHEGEAPVPDGAGFVEVVLREKRLEPTRFRFIHPDGTPATDVTTFSLYEDTEFRREDLKPDEYGVITLDLPPGPNRWSRQPKMAGHRLVGSAPRFAVPTPDPVEIVMERADRIVLALDAQGKGIEIDPQAVKTHVADSKGKVEFDSHFFGVDEGLLCLRLTFRTGPATIRIEYAGETYTHEHEKPGREPVRIKLREESNSRLRAGSGR